VLLNDLSVHRGKVEKWRRCVFPPVNSPNTTDIWNLLLLQIYAFGKVGEWECCEQRGKMGKRESGETVKVESGKA